LAECVIPSVNVPSGLVPHVEASYAPESNADQSLLLLLQSQLQ
jgi:hypothetical protein